MSRFAIHNTPLAGLKVVERQQVGDSRGFLSRLFCADGLAAAGWAGPIAQINQTLTQKRGTVRGMHFQLPPHAEMKFVSCIKGAVWDVAVDVRTGSPTFLQWHAEELSASNRRALLIPQGFAHGFQTFEDDSELLYLHSASYAANAEAALNALDARLSINWPLPVAERSARDARHAMLNPQFTGVGL
jgi:dTDP-4-dehydrorhamnose 3,5-epimerase